ncbi:hypothetical protein OAO87_03885 [bacterium]|nr:hypothetical protein [bacterium]
MISLCEAQGLADGYGHGGSAHAMVNFSTLIWDLSVVYGRPAAYHRATGPP